MAHTYDAEAIGTSTAEGRVNLVRLLIADTVDTDEQPAWFQDEELSALLSLYADSPWYAAAEACETLARDHARRAKRMERDGTTHERWSPKELLATAASLRERALVGTEVGIGQLQTGQIVSSDQQYREERVPQWVSIYGTEPPVL